MTEATLTAHLDACVAEAGAFALARNAKGWTATGTRKGGRKELVGAGVTPIAALASLLTAIRGAPEPEDD